MGRSLGFDLCPLCGEEIPERGNGSSDLPNHLKTCKKREETLGRIEREAERARARRRERARRLL